MTESCSLLCALALSAMAVLPIAQAAPVPQKPAVPAQSATPRINGPGVFGIRPGTPLLYAIPASGQRPLEFSVTGLPPGLSLDTQAGLITGVAPEAGTYALTFRVRNAAGAAEKPFRLVCGDQLCLTPPMGWNSWNAVGENITEEVVRQTADALVAGGLKDAGYQYLVIDDHWEGIRDPQGQLSPNPKKFPSGMKALADYVHSRGLKFGIYSDAGDKTCGGEAGSCGFEDQDAKLFASWGVDYLKYDYCNAPEDFQEAIRRYTRMGQALKATPRSIVFSICEWGPRSPWLWGRQVGGHLWRTSFDVGDLWDTPHNTHSCIGILASVDAVANLGRYAGPGGWNDPDMLVVGLGNRGFIKGGGCSADEYQTQMSLWCMLSAPLMLGCDLRQLDGETLTRLLNPDLLALDQDELGQPASRVARTGSTEVWKKNLAGGSWALALLNRGEAPAAIDVRWEVLELKPGDAFVLRDLLSGENLGTFSGRFQATVSPHATKVVRAVPGPKLPGKALTGGNGENGASAR